MERVRKRVLAIVQFNFNKFDTQDSLSSETIIETHSLAINIFYAIRRTGYYLLYTKDWMWEINSYRAFFLVVV